MAISRYLQILAAATVLCGPAARAELLSFGLKGGVPLLDLIDTGIPSSVADTQRFLIGPTAEVHLPAGFGVEVDALYKNLKYRQSNVDTSGSTWEFPLLLKARLLAGPVRPYLEAGASFRRFSDLSGTVTLKPTNRVTPGLVLGGGVEVKALIVRVSGELRYTYFTSDSFSNIGLSSGGLRALRNQADLIFGITF